MDKRDGKWTIRTNVRAGATEDQIRAAANQVTTDRHRASIANADATRALISS